MTAKPIIGYVGDSTEFPLNINIPRLLETRALIQANSGGGKSYALRRFLEQTRPHVQQIVLDIEGEYATLRERFDYVICAPNGADAVANVQTATLLARRLRETRVSAVIDLYELKMADRKRFVRLFLEELIDAPKTLWHHCLVAIDEAHQFCPEKGQGEAECAEVVMDLQSRGRKRGLCGLLATQRLAKLSKNAVAECQNKLIGLTNLLDDQKRAADELGMNAKDAIPILRNLDPGQFFCYGPALSKDVTKVMVGPVMTTHPEPGHKQTLAPPPPSEKIKKLLAELADLPKQAQEEARTLTEVKAENARLKRELSAAKSAQPVVKQPAVKIEKIKVPTVGQKTAEKLRKSVDDMRKLAARLTKAQAELNDGIARIDQRATLVETELANATKAQTPAVVVHAAKELTPQVTKALHEVASKAEAAVTSNESLHPAAEKMLTALQRNFPKTYTWIEIATLAGLVPGNGYFYGGKKSLLESGLAYETSFGKITAKNHHPSAGLITRDEIVRLWSGKLKPPAPDMLRVIYEQKETSVESLAAAIGKKPGNGYWYGGMAALREAGLCEQHGSIIQLTPLLAGGE